jgi:hypothetical protein
VRVHVYVHVCVRVHVHMCVCVCAHVRMCVCGRECARARASTHARGRVRACQAVDMFIGRLERTMLLYNGARACTSSCASTLFLSLALPLLLLSFLVLPLLLHVANHCEHIGVMAIMYFHRGIHGRKSCVDRENHGRKSYVFIWNMYATTLSTYT